MALVLAQIGWQVTVLQGGYRLHLCTRPTATVVRFTYQMLCGLTGTEHTTNSGSVALKLEGLANHRGSLQEWEEVKKYFESLLLRGLQG